jgi:hypothetical protein
MKKIILLFLLLPFFSKTHAQHYIQVFEDVLYFDGYAARVDSPPPPPGVIRHKNSLYARKLTTEELNSIGNTLKMKVTVRASCDNYDRIGNVNMALVSKDSSTYTPANVPRIEIARFITPFMNKNVFPNSVPYQFDINNIAQLLRDTGITNRYDIWMELEIFGVPYAANTQVAGCSGRNDVFYGSLQLITDTAAPPMGNNLLIPLARQNNFNNYQAAATDTLGKTMKTFSFTIPTKLTDASYYLVISNHGANSGGEEYNRRMHYVYADDSLKLYFKPGRISCEPFRVYNTQANGIYGSTPKSNDQWQSFSNWCPGDVIDIRRINMGPMDSGLHTFSIRVPDAVFTGAQGNFPLSVYLHGKTSGTIDPADTVDTSVNVQPGGIKLYPNPVSHSSGPELTVETKAALVIRIIDELGRVVFKKERPADRSQISTNGWMPGVYIIQAFFSNKWVSKKFIVAP